MRKEEIIMKKFINQVDDLLAESLSGFASAHRDIVRLNLDPNYLVRAEKAQNKVALISGGGSGHEPLHSGFVGVGMLDAACPGHVFTSPTPDQMLAAAEAVECGKGVLFIVKNYAGDVMNFEMAAEMLSCEHATVITSDDVAVENSTYTTGRRGVAGTVIVEKVVGSLAETGADLATCKALGERVNRRTASMGVALTSCTVPAAGRPTFDIGADELEMGVGIHGEPGRRREALRCADDIVADLVHAILEDLKPAPGSEALLMVNGFSGTPLMELYLLYHAAEKLLKQRGINITRSLVGDYTTSLEMAGASITLCLLDDEIRRHWDAPVHTAALRWGR
jgi:dihydroxyacetone kinase-like protein